MARIIVKSPFMKANGGGHAGNYLKYIAKREGVERTAGTEKYLPATATQRKVIDELLQKYPDASDLFERQDYLEKPNRGNADELILRIAELHNELFENR